MYITGRAQGRHCGIKVKHPTLWQQVHDTRLYCGDDALVLRVDERHGACHTRLLSDFYNAVRGENEIVVFTNPEWAYARQ